MGYWLRRLGQPTKYYGFICGKKQSMIRDNLSSRNSAQMFNAKLTPIKASRGGQK
jgi:hypothetical protein